MNYNGITYYWVTLMEWSRISIFKTNARWILDIEIGPELKDKFFRHQQVDAIT